MPSAGAGRTGRLLGVTSRAPAAVHCYLRTPEYVVYTYLVRQRPLDTSARLRRSLWGRSRGGEAGGKVGVR